MIVFYKGHNILFIVGCPRSGTTWLQRILANHPLVRTGQESDLFTDYVGPQLRHWRRETDTTWNGRGGVGLGCYFTEEEFLELLREYMGKLLKPLVGNLRPGEIFVEKTPSHALFIPEILELLPETNIIHIKRDARDTVASILAASRSWGAKWAPRYAWKASLMWVRHVKAVRQAVERPEAKPRVHELTYEDLHASPHDCIRNLCNQIGLNWGDGAILQAIEANTKETTKITGGTPIPLGGEFGKKTGNIVKEPEAFVRKAKVGTWREDLTLLEKLQVWVVAHKVMKEAGYSW